MAAALYEPGLGYYAQRVREPGRGGDFSTAATLGQALGKAIANWARKRRRQLKLEGQVALVEIGAGGGQLAQTVLQQLGWLGRRGFSYHIVEVSSPLRAAQERLLAGRGVTWHENPASALQAAGGKALLFSNELVDAFPCLVLKRDSTVPGGWRELHLEPAAAEPGWSAQWPAAREAALARAAGACFLERAGESLPLAEGQVIEVHARYREWLADLAAELRQGALLTVDYGGVASGIYHRRPYGTLRAYFQHLPLHGAEVFARAGHQDLTADVNFTDLQTWGDQLGLATSFLLSQREFIDRYAPGAVKNAAEEFLVNPLGAGEAFLVLEQVTAPQH